jgi:hypothetical protein
MTAQMLQIDELPRRPSTKVKNGWGELIQEVRESGTVAVTSYDKIEFVIMGADQYRRIAQIVESVESTRKAALAELTAEFDRQLAEMQNPSTRARIDAMMACDGRTPTRPKAGSSY